MNALNDFSNYSVDQGYYLCLIFLFMLAALVLRIFEYNRIWTFCNNKFSLGEIAEKDIFLDQGIEVNESWKSRIPSRGVSEYVKEGVDKKKVQAFSLR